MMGQMRNIRGALQRKLKANIPLKPPVLSWMVTYAGQLITRFAQGEDGLTPFQRVSGKAFKQQLPELRESVWRPLHNKAGRSDDRGKCMLRWALAV